MIATTAIARLVETLEGTPAFLQTVLSNWAGLDEGLREQYATDLEWLLRSVSSHLDSDDLVEADRARLLARIAYARRAMRELGADLDDKVGFSVDGLFPHPHMADAAMNWGGTAVVPVNFFQRRIDVAIRTAILPFAVCVKADTSKAQKVVCDGAVGTSAVVRPSTSESETAVILASAA